MEVGAPQLIPFLVMCPTPSWPLTAIVERPMRPPWQWQTISDKMTSSFELFSRGKLMFFGVETFGLFPCAFSVVASDSVTTHL